MTKDVLVSISGVQSELIHPSDENEPIEVITPGTYYYKNGKHYIIFDEMVEEMAETVHNRIKIAEDGGVEILKTGATNAHMVFEKNKKNLTYYGTAYGQMLVGVNTRRMQVDVAEEEIRVKVDYQLDINHEPLADCRIKMHIMSRETADISKSGV